MISKTAQPTELTKLFLLHHSPDVPYEGRATDLAQVGLLPRGSLTATHTHLPHA